MVATGTTTGSSSLDSPGTTNTAGLRSHSHGVTSREQLVDRKRLLLVVAAAKQVSGNPTRQHEDLFWVFFFTLPRPSEAAAVFSEGSTVLGLAETVCGSSDFGLKLLAAVTSIC